MHDGDEAFQANSCALIGTAIARTAVTAGRALHKSHKRNMSLAGLKRIQSAIEKSLTTAQARQKWTGVLWAGGTLPQRC